MEFTFTDEKGQVDTFDTATAGDMLARLAKFFDLLEVGESVKIERTA